MPSDSPIDQSSPQDTQSPQITEDPLEPCSHVDSLPTSPSKPDGLKLKRSPKNRVRVGHRNRITALIKLGNIDAALAHAHRNKELEWFTYKLACFRPDLAANVPQPTEGDGVKPLPSDIPPAKATTIPIMLNTEEQPSRPAVSPTLPPAPQPLASQTGGEGGLGTVGAQEPHQSLPVGNFSQCPVNESSHDKAEGGLEADKGAIGANVEVGGVLGGEKGRMGYKWPEECIGKVVGYCGNRQLMQLEVEVWVEANGMGFVDNRVKGKKVCSVWKGGYSLYVGEEVRVKLERSIGEEAWYEVVARGSVVGEARLGSGLGEMGTNDGMTVAPVGFEGQAMRKAGEAVKEEPVVAPAPAPAPAPVKDESVYELAERERQRAMDEMMQLAQASGSGSEL